MVDFTGLKLFDDGWINVLVHQKPAGHTTPNWLWRSGGFGTKLSADKSFGS
jgi:hypothetical protein